MIKIQGKDIANKRAAPRAVVTVKCDYWVVSFAIGIVGVIYKVSTFGSSRIATIGRVHGGYQLISMLSGMAQARSPTLLPN